MSDNKSPKKGFTADNESRVSPQSAMNDYFGEMFGSSEEDPLKKLSSKDPSLGESFKTVSDSVYPVSGVKATKLPDTTKALIPKPKLKPKKQTQYKPATSYVEPEKIVGTISPLIIPAAFPKLAPVTPELVQKKVVTKEAVKPKVDTKLNQEVATKQRIQTETKIKAKAKIDKKTALALLEKNKSRLTLAQREKLKQKLKTLHGAKQETKQKVVVKQASASEIDIAAKVSIKSRLVTPKAEEHKQAKFDAHAKDAHAIKAEQKTLPPDWASQRFECLLFSVAGLKLAVPLISLGAIYKIEKDFVPLVGRAKWFIGLYHHLGSNVRVVDTAQWVMPERYSEAVRQGYKFVIRLGGNDWGIACDAVHESIQLNPDQVQWRTERTKRAWLLGTVIEHMCALIDADTLSQMLEQEVTANPRIFS